MDDAGTFTVGVLTGVVLTAVVAYGLAPKIAADATRRAVTRLVDELSLPHALSVQIADRAAVLVAAEVKRAL